MSKCILCGSVCTKKNIGWYNEKYEDVIFAVCYSCYDFLDRQETQNLIEEKANILQQELNKTKKDKEPIYSQGLLF